MALRKAMALSSSSTHSWTTSHQGSISAACIRPQNICVTKPEETVSDRDWLSTVISSYAIWRILLYCLWFASQLCQSEEISLATSIISLIFQVKCCSLCELQNRSQEGNAQFIMLSRFLRALEKDYSFYITDLSWSIASADAHQLAQVLLSGCPREYRALLCCEVS